MNPIKARLKLAHYRKGNCISAEHYDCYLCGDHAYAFDGDYIIRARGGLGGWTIIDRIDRSALPALILVLTQMKKDEDHDNA